MLARISALDPALKSDRDTGIGVAAGGISRGGNQGRSRSRAVARDSDRHQGSRLYQGNPDVGRNGDQHEFRADYDATDVSRLATARSILLGKLHMTERATLEHHPKLPYPINPWRLDLWTRVSSSGSGVATASGLCFASLGSDTGGSIRFPSACNGLTGVKPTWGRVSRYGICDLAASYDTIVPMTRSAQDCAAVLGTIAGFDANDMTSLRAPVNDYLGALNGIDGLRGKKVGVDWAYIAKGVTPKCWP
jgi:amidase